MSFTAQNGLNNFKAALSFVGHLDSLGYAVDEIDVIRGADTLLTYDGTAFTEFNDAFKALPQNFSYTLRVTATKGGDSLSQAVHMPVISSNYWNMVHGARPEDVLQDAEGLYTMRNLAKNMAFFLKCKAAGIKAGVAFPEKEPPIFTNFIR